MNETETAPDPTTETAIIEDAPKQSPFVICQHTLTGESVQELEVAQGAHILDIHLIDGAFALRTVEDEGAEESETLTIRSYALGGRLEGQLTHIPSRAGGTHFFVQDRSLSPD